MKSFLTATAVFEGITGLLLLTVPSLFISILLGATLNEPGEVLARLTGVALFSLVIVCWSCRNDAQKSSGILRSLLFYNVATDLVLLYSYSAGFNGIGLWPAALLHVVLGIWCIQLFKNTLKHTSP